MENRTIGIIVSIMVGVIMIGGVLVPVLNDAAADSTTFNNRTDSMFEMVEINENSNYVFEWKYTDPTHAIVNGEIVSLKSASIICNADTFLIRYGSDSTGYYLQGVGSTGNIFVTSGGSTPKDLTITIADGTLTATATGTESVTTPVSDGFAIAPSGDWVMKSPDQIAYLHGDSRIVAMGLTFMDVWNRGFYIDGTVNSVNVTCFNSETFTISNIVINSSVNEKYTDLYELDKISFTASNGTDSWDATYNYFIVPAEITAEKVAGSPLGEYSGLVFTIPVIVIVSLLVAAVATIGRKY